MIRLTSERMLRGRNPGEPTTMDETSRVGPLGCVIVAFSVSRKGHSHNAKVISI